MVHRLRNRVVRCKLFIRYRPFRAADHPITKEKRVVKKARKPRVSKAKPDKNQYWLLNPVPIDQMRSFSTDRPTKSNVPYTVDAGHLQYETDLVNFTHQIAGTMRTDTLLMPNPTLKVGLTNKVDLEVNAPFAGVHNYDTATKASNSSECKSLSDER